MKAILGWNWFWDETDFGMKLTGMKLTGTRVIWDETYSGMKFTWDGKYLGWKVFWDGKYLGWKVFWDEQSQYRNTVLPLPLTKGWSKPLHNLPFTLLYYSCILTFALIADTLLLLYSYIRPDCWYGIWSHVRSLSVWRMPCDAVSCRCHPLWADQCPSTISVAKLTIGSSGEQGLKYDRGNIFLFGLVFFFYF